MLRIAAPIMMVITLLSLAVTACTPENLPTRGDAQQAVCQALGGLRTAVAQVSDVDAETEMADIRAAKQRLDTAVEAVRRANEVLQNARIAETITAYDNLNETLEGIGNDEKVGQAAESVRAAVAKVDSALSQANSSLGCGQ